MKLSDKDKAFKKAIYDVWPAADWHITVGASPGRACCGLENVDEDDDEARQTYDEGSFSWQNCESCNNNLGGHRYPAHAIHTNAFGPNATKPDHIIHIDICEDCLCYHANGELPPD